jgi:hypothetical protein
MTDPQAVAVVLSAVVILALILWAREGDRR